MYFPSATGTWARVDTTQPFTAKESWSVFDTKTISAGSGGFHGLVFDGRYVYGVPLNVVADDGGVSAGRVVTRLDTTADFANASAWAAHSLPVEAEGNHGGAFDGRYVYFIPHFGSPLFRYDTTKPFDDDGAWESVVVGSPGAMFGGAVFDGRFLHLVPAFKGQAKDSPASGTTYRYDSQLPFVPASFVSFDLGAVDPAAGGFAGGTFDGRYVWFAPHATRAENPDFAAPSIVVRYDTTSAYELASSWQSFDTRSIDPALKPRDFVGALFDGRWVYLVPARGGAIVRFDARSPRGLPARWNASFL